MPFVLVFEFARWRHIGRVAHQRSTIDPFHDRCDLLVGERAVVLEMPHAHILVDVPRRHLPGENLFPDCLGPRSGLFIGQQRHRGKGAWPVTDLTLLLQNRRYVLGEGDLLCRRRVHHDEYEQHGQDAQVPALPNGPHIEPPGENSPK